MEEAHILPQGRKRHQRDAPVRQSETESRKFRRHDLRQDPERHLDRRRRMEIPVIGRLHPQLVTARLDADIPESGGIEGADQALRQRIGTIFRLFPPGMIVDGNQGLSQVEARGKIDPELLPPLPADVDLRPIHGLPAQTDIPFRGHRLLKVFRLRRIMRLLFILDRAVFHDCHELIGDRPLDTSEKLRIFQPGFSIREHLHLDALPLTGQRLCPKAAVAEPQGKIEGIDLLAHHDVLRRINPGPVGVHNPQGHSRAIFPLRKKLVFQADGLVLVIAVFPHPGRGDVQDLGNGPVCLQPFQNADGSVIPAIGIGLTDPHAEAPFRHHPRRRGFQQPGPAPVRRPGERLITRLRRHAPNQHKKK
ncbi:MAG: hypothetical protein A4E69_01769 [Syntrophus sp. PtaB.Bin138]|nr:MAG: hypothetical protein A4E69_01769 [Syntrophus sp. PtaB.Bin138]